LPLSVDICIKTLWVREFETGIWKTKNITYYCVIGKAYLSGIELG